MSISYPMQNAPTDLCCLQRAMCCLQSAALLVSGVTHRIHNGGGLTLLLPVELVAVLASQTGPEALQQ